MTDYCDILIPLLRNHDFDEEYKDIDPLVSYEFAGDLLVFLAKVGGNRISYVSLRDLSDMGVTREEALRSAIKNVNTYSKSRETLGDDKVWNIIRRNSETGLADRTNTAFAFDNNHLQALSLEVEDDLAGFFPTQWNMVCTFRGSAKREVQLRQAARTQYDEAVADPNEHPLSPVLYVWKENRWTSSEGEAE